MEKIILLYFRRFIMDMLRDNYYKQSTAPKWNEIPQKIKT